MRDVSGRLLWPTVMVFFWGTVVLGFRFAGLDLGTFGDAFAPLAAFANFLVLLVGFDSLALQRQSLDATREELKLQREEFAMQRKEFEGQREAQEQQAALALVAAELRHLALQEDLLSSARG
jgi:hypothetical protein